jgi:thioredoxin-related protein
MKPVVDGLEREWKAGHVIRVDVLSSVGREFGSRHGFRATPTFVLFDSQGNKVNWWVGRPPLLSELK